MQQVVVLGQGGVAVDFDQSDVQLPIDEEVETEELEGFVSLRAIWGHAGSHCYFNDFVDFVENEIEEPLLPFFFEVFL